MGALWTRPSRNRNHLDTRLFSAHGPLPEAGSSLDLGTGVLSVTGPAEGQTDAQKPPRRCHFLCGGETPVGGWQPQAAAAPGRRGRSEGCRNVLASEAQWEAPLSHQDSLRAQARLCPAPPPQEMGSQGGVCGLSRRHQVQQVWGTHAAPPQELSLRERDRVMHPRPTCAPKAFLATRMARVWAQVLSGTGAIWGARTWYGKGPSSMGVGVPLGYWISPDSCPSCPPQALQGLCWTLRGRGGCHRWALRSENRALDPQSSRPRSRSQAVTGVRPEDPNPGRVDSVRAGGSVGPCPVFSGPAVQWAGPG